MSKVYKILFTRLKLNHAYGQLIALILVPIAILTSVGIFWVYSETTNAAKQQQRSDASAILALYQQTAKDLLVLIQTQPDQYDRAQNMMQKMFNEQNLKRAVLIDAKGQTYLSVGYQNNRFWPNFTTNSAFLGPINYNNNSIYGAKLDRDNPDSVWLMIELDNQPLEIVQYKILLSLAVTGLVTLLMLLFCLNVFSRRWLAPIYEIRMQIQRLNADSLDQQIVIDSTGELKLLQRDIANVVKRLHFSFLELKEHTEQTEEDLRRTLDTLEVQNITYRQARDQAISSNQSKSVFLANISHELRTPLNSIDGFIHLLLRQQNLSNEQNLYLQTIRKSSAHLLALINDVLDFSKIDAGKLELETAPFDLEEAIFDVMDMLSPLAAQKHINMAFYYAEDIPQTLVGDALRFKQILTNLISNAIKFTPDGEIIVRVRMEDDDIGQCLLHFSVQDSGIGLSGTDRKKLFESFSQGDASVTRQFGGTGLGLAISKQLVHLMRGQIGFEDNQERAPTEKGSTFWFTASFKVDEQHEWVEHPRFEQLRVVSYLAHPATASVLRSYLENYHVAHIETQSILDLFSRLNQLNQQENTWLIVDHSGDTEALLKEIRQRYQGNLAVYGYQMSLEPNMLNEYRARPLYQPLSRRELVQLLSNQPIFEPEPQQFNGQGLHVLAVDDHLPNLIVLEALLGELNVTTTKALSGQKAIDIIQERIEQKSPPFDLVFMDIQMPVMSGIDTTRAIRSLESTLDTGMQLPIIALTAHALADEKQKLLKVGMNDYVTKPIQMEQIIQILTHWTKNNFTTPSLNIEPKRVIEAIDPDILNWEQSVQLAANKEDLAQDLLRMLVDSFDNEVEEMQQLIEMEDFPQLEHVLHRLYGATRYVGTPSLQRVSGEFEQFVSTLRKERRSADPRFIQETLARFEALNLAIEQVKKTAQTILNSQDSSLI